MWANNYDVRSTPMGRAISGIDVTLHVVLMWELILKQVC